MPMQIIPLVEASGIPLHPISLHGSNTFLPRPIFMLYLFDKHFVSVFGDSILSNCAVVKINSALNNTVGFLISKLPGCFAVVVVEMLIGRSLP